MHAKHIFVGENFHEKLEAPRKNFVVLIFVAGYYISIMRMT